ncbi:6040_t:CDS:1 [Gigaspora margarita]|uniref:6040_t:CDS:1 n=1 Tax=Gigaspora margarita TaxID=4874 RepID=A0ABN7V3E5_GIGMA|nr:6040_t:CDS:1 [Gigaspora margarita]
MSSKKKLKELSREQEFKKLFKGAIEAYKSHEFKTSYNSFQSVTFGHKIENTKLAFDAKYFLAIHLMYGFGVSKNPNKALRLFKEVSKSNSKHKNEAKKCLKN